MSAWVEWIKKFAAEHNTTYGCALSNPKCASTYRRWKQKHGHTLTKKDKEKIETEETSQMGGEDINRVSPKKKEMTEQELQKMKKAEYNKRYRDKQKAKKGIEGGMIKRGKPLTKEEKIEGISKFLKTAPSAIEEHIKSHIPANIYLNKGHLYNRLARDTIRDIKNLNEDNERYYTNLFRSSAHFIENEEDEGMKRMLFNGLKHDNDEKDRRTEEFGDAVKEELNQIVDKTDKEKSLLKLANTPNYWADAEFWNGVDNLLEYYQNHNMIGMGIRKYKYSPIIRVKGGMMGMDEDKLEKLIKEPLKPQPAFYPPELVTRVHKDGSISFRNKHFMKRLEDAPLSQPKSSHQPTKDELLRGKLTHLGNNYKAEIPYFKNDLNEEARKIVDKREAELRTAAIKTLQQLDNKNGAEEFALRMASRAMPEGAFQHAIEVLPQYYKDENIPTAINHSL